MRDSERQINKDNIQGVFDYIAERKTQLDRKWGEGLGKLQKGELDDLSQRGAVLGKELELLWSISYRLGVELKPYPREEEVSR